MSRIPLLAKAQIYDQGAVELYLRVEQIVFGVSFLDLAEARDAARLINHTGRDVEIFEKKSGKIIESSAGRATDAKAQPIPTLLVETGPIAKPASTAFMFGIHP